MFTLDTTPLPGRAGLSLELRRAGAPLSVRATVELWQRAPRFAAWFNGALGAGSAVRCPAGAARRAGRGAVRSPRLR